MRARLPLSLMRKAVWTLLMPRIAARLSLLPLPSVLRSLNHHLRPLALMARITLANFECSANPCVPALEKLPIPRQRVLRSAKYIPPEWDAAIHYLQLTDIRIVNTDQSGMTVPTHSEAHLMGVGPQPAQSHPPQRRRHTTGLDRYRPFPSAIKTPPEADLGCHCSDGHSTIAGLSDRQLDMGNGWQCGTNPWTEQDGYDGSLGRTITFSAYHTFALHGEIVGIIAALIATASSTGQVRIITDYLDAVRTAETARRPGFSVFSWRGALICKTPRFDGPVSSPNRPSERGTQGLANWTPAVIRGRALRVSTVGRYLN